MEREDRELISDLCKRLSVAALGKSFRNREIEKNAAAGIGVNELHSLRDLLLKNGSFKIRIERHRWRDSDGEAKIVTICRAAGTDMWPMGTSYWLRDNALIGARLAFLPAHRSGKFNKLRKLGRELLLSALTIASSCQQLKRFRRIINSTANALQKDPQNWPHVMFSIGENLNGVKDEAWSHKQDAWQMLAYYALRALQEGVLSHEDLGAKQRAFFALLVPFLQRVKFYKNPNSGSWEEIEAVRSSVVIWEVMLLEKIRDLIWQKEFAFLRTRSRRGGSRALSQNSYKPMESQIARLVDLGNKTLLKMMPYESVCVSERDPRYRQADMALVYLLQLEFPQYLVKKRGAALSFGRKVEKRILAQLESLYRSSVGGMARYKDDPYQRCGFFRNITTDKLRKLYGAPSGDASAHYVTRFKIVPQGPEAAWSHSVWQLSSWAGARYRASGEQRYFKLQLRFFREALRLITARNDYSLEQHKDGKGRVIKLSAFRIPECVIADRNERGRLFYFPSPHTPLNWAVAEAIDAFVSLEISLLGQQ